MHWLEKELMMVSMILDASFLVLMSTKLLLLSILAPNIFNIHWLDILTPLFNKTFTPFACFLVPVATAMLVVRFCRGRNESYIT